MGFRAAVVTFPGSNCDRDLAVALEKVSGEPALRVPLVLRRPLPRRDDDGHLVELRRQRRAEPDLRDQLLQEFGGAGTAQPDIGGPAGARGAALRFLLTRLYDWVHTPPDALVKRKDPQEYLAKLRFHRNIASIADYGL